MLCIRTRISREIEKSMLLYFDGRVAFLGLLVVDDAGSDSRISRVSSDDISRAATYLLQLPHHNNSIIEKNLDAEIHYHLEVYVAIVVCIHRTSPVHH